MNFEIAPKETEVQLNWDDARLYCFSLDMDGKIGWRLPTKEELNEIHRSDNDFKKDWYWSSTENSGYFAWVQYMFNGNQYYYSKGFGGYYVRAIRDLKDD